jgi:hypothetical protein
MGPSSIATLSRAAVGVTLLAAFLLAAGTDTAGAAAAKATLRVVKLSPFTVRGTGFQSGERVTITLSGGAKGTARGTATAAGAVSVSFPQAKVTGACTPYTLRAVGAGGTTVTFKRTVTAASCKPDAKLKFDGTSVVVAGTRFRPGEKLSVTLVEGGGPHTRSTTASSAGAFNVNFGALPMSECTAYKLTIKGTLGSRFSYSQEALPC